MAIQTEFVTIPVSDGTTMRTYVARPEGTPRAGLIVFQEIFGINSHIRDITERFAREGYLSVAPELFHRTGPGFESGYTDMQPAFGHMSQMTDAGLEADIRATHVYLKSVVGELPIAAIGYCMGGRCATLASIIEPLACGISYYGGGIAPNQFNPGIMDRLKNLQGPMLFLWAGKDSFIPAEAVQSITAELRANNKSFISTEFSDADHGFFCDQRGSYHPQTAAVAWPMTLAFLQSRTQKAAKA